MFQGLEILSKDDNVGVIIVLELSGGGMLGYIRNPLSHIWIHRMETRTGGLREEEGRY